MRTTPDAPLVEFLGATVVLGGHVALDDVRLTLHAGEHVAILGPNGSGKSTLIKSITRDVRPLLRDDGPPLRVMGRDRWDIFELREVLGIVSDELQETFERRLSVRDAVVSGFFGSVGVYRNHRVTAEMRERAEDAMRFLEVSHLAERWMDTLSTGEARRALVARALVREPLAMVLDEPYSGLDPHARHHVREALRRLARRGVGLVLVTHDVSDIVPEVTRVVMLRGGRVVVDAPKEQALTAEALAAVFDIPATVTEHDGWYHLW